MHTHTETQTQQQQNHFNNHDTKKIVQWSLLLQLIEYKLLYFCSLPLTLCRSLYLALFSLCDRFCSDGPVISLFASVSFSTSPFHCRSPFSLFFSLSPISSTISLFWYAHIYTQASGRATAFRESHRQWKGKITWKVVFFCDNRKW